MFAFDIKIFWHCRAIMSEQFGASKHMLFVLQRLGPCSQFSHVYISKRPNDYVWSSRCVKMRWVSIAMELHLCVFIVWSLSAKHTIAKLGPRSLIRHTFLPTWKCQLGFRPVGSCDKRLEKLGNKFLGLAKTKQERSQKPSRQINWSANTDMT